MSDNTQIPDSDLIATDDIGGVKHQRVKIVLGTNGVSDGDVSDANPMPVVGSFFPVTQPVSASVLPLPSGASTEATLAALKAAIDALSAKIAACDTGSVTLDAGTLAALETITVSNPTAQGLTDAQLRAAAVPVSGMVSVSNLPAAQEVYGAVAVSNLPGTQPVSGTFWQATQPVSGTVTLDAPTLAALETTSISGSVAVTGTFWQATQPVSGTVTVSNPTAQGLTDAQIRATALPVSGEVSVSNFPATQPVSGSVSVSNFPAGGTGLTDTELRAAAVPVSLAGAAQDATVQALQALNDTMLYMLGAILEKMPRVTGNDQAAVSIEAGTLATVTTVATVSNMTSIGGKQAAQVPDAVSMAGANHLYRNIIVS